MATVAIKGTQTSSAATATPLYQFGPFCLDPGRGLLLRDGFRVPLTGKALDTLVALIKHQSETVSKQDLISAVWGQAAVEENNLNQCISAIRKALGERRGEHEYIVTVTGVGYRFVAPVTLVSKQEPEAVPAADARESRRPMIFALAAVGVLAALGLVWTVARPTLTTRTAGKLESLPRNTQTMELYLEGRRIARQRLSPNLNRASELFQRAIDKDPNFALAYAALAEIYAIKVANSLATPDALRAGEAAANKALALNPALPDAHASLGLLKYARWDWDGAEREYAVALRLDPTNAHALMRSAMVSFVMGRFSEAESRLHRAQLLDPSNGAITGMLCELYYYWRRYDDCIREADRILQFDPANVAFAWFRKTLVLIENRRFAEAAIAAYNYAKSVPRGDANSQVLAIWIDTRGERTAFEPRYQEILNAHSREHISPYNIAVTCCDRR